jgi:AcrR family transcriptional regulator
MSKNNRENSWIDAGYNQFAAEGLEGLQVERLARITGLNKSGYYHYFGDRETFLGKLMERHVHIAVSYTNELKQIKQFDPEFIELLIKYTTPLMFTNQLIRNHQHEIMVLTYTHIFEMIDPVLSDLFADFIGLQDYPEISFKYYNQVRYMFHSVITHDRYNYSFLRDFMYEAREVIQRAAKLVAKPNA